ncbi:hypothetical protein CHUAL_000086 [Chamberlinius hualienensis]
MRNLKPMNEKVEKMEEHLIQRLQQLEDLIENNNKKTDHIEKSIDTLQVNQNTLKWKTEYKYETIESKFQEIDLGINEIKPSQVFTDIQKKLEELTVMVKLNENQSQKLSQRIKNIEVDFTNKFDKTTEDIDQLKLEIRKSLKKEVEQFKKVEDEMKQAITQLQWKVEAAYNSIEKIKSDKIGQLKKDEDETKKIIDTLNKNMKEKYDEYIQHLKHSEKQLKKISEENENNKRIIKNHLSKTIEEIAQLQSKVETAFREIEEIKSDEIKLWKKVEEETKQTIDTLSNDIKDKNEKCIQRHLSNEVQLKTISENNERIINNSLSKTTNDINQLQLKVKEASKAIEEIKSNEIGQLKTEVIAIEERIKQINLNKELDKVIK